VNGASLRGPLTRLVVLIAATRFRALATGPDTPADPAIAAPDRGARAPAGGAGAPTPMSEEELEPAP